MSAIQDVLPELRLIGVACALGAPGPGPEDGPAALKKLGIAAAPSHAGLSAHWETTLAPRHVQRWPALTDLCQRLADVTANVVAAGKLPVVLGGDHSMAAGTWRGIGRGLATQGTADLGLIWIDAHLDAHTRDTSVSGNPHGMPLAALLGVGAAELEAVTGPLIDPRRVAVIGARSWEDDELCLLRALGVRIFPMNEIHLRGLPAVMADALALVRKSARYGISLDLDAIDPAQAPGVAVPATDGLNAGELRQTLRGLARDARLVAIEIAEYDPSRDIGHRTGRLAVNMLEALCLPGLTLLHGSAAAGDATVALADEQLGRAA